MWRCLSSVDKLVFFFFFCGLHFNSSRYVWAILQKRKLTKKFSEDVAAASCDLLEPLKLALICISGSGRWGPRQKRIGRGQNWVLFTSAVIIGDSTEETGVDGACGCHQNGIGFAPNFSNETLVSQSPRQAQINDAWY